MANPSRPQLWNTAADQAQKSLEQMESMLFRLTSVFEELRDEWILARARYMDAVEELISHQQYYGSNYPPENLSSSAYSKKLEEVSHFDFDELIEKIPDLEKFFAPLEEFSSWEFGDIYRAKGFDLPKGYGRD